MRDINGEIAGYRGLVESLARKFVGRNDAEFDDLVQVGLIKVWVALEQDVTPAAHIIEGAMKNWVRTLGRQIGRGSYDRVSLDEIVGLDDGMHLTRHDVIASGPIPTPGHDPLA